MNLPANPNKDFIALNPHLYGNHTPCLKVQNAQQPECPATLDSGDARETQGSGCPLVRFTLRKCQLLDVDAKYGSVKDLLDGLAKAGLIHGDGEGEITLEVLQQKVKTRAEECTIILIEGIA